MKFHQKYCVEENLASITYIYVYVFILIFTFNNEIKVIFKFVKSKNCHHEYKYVIFLINLKKNKFSKASTWKVKMANICVFSKDESLIGVQKL